MSYFDVNWLAVMLATIASMALGAAWYMGLSKQWLKATGRTIEEIQSGSGGSAAPFIWAAGCQLVMAYFLALFTPALMGEVTIASTIIVGIHIWLGFMVTSLVLNHRYQGMSWNLAFIDGGYLLGTMIVQGAVIGVLG